MHTSCQSCRFWLQTGRWALLQCCCNTFVSRGYLQCSQVGWGEQSACLFQGEIGDWCCLVGMLLVMWSLEMLPCSSALLFFSSFCQIGPPLYTLKPLFLFSFFSSSSEIIQSFFFSLFLICFLPSPHCFVLLNSSHSFCFQTAALLWVVFGVFRCECAHSCMHKWALSRKHLCACCV